MLYAYKCSQRRVKVCCLKTITLVAQNQNKEKRCLKQREVCKTKVCIALRVFKVLTFKRNGILYSLFEKPCFLVCLTLVNYKHTTIRVPWTGQQLLCHAPLQKHAIDNLALIPHMGVV